MEMLAILEEYVHGHGGMELVDACVRQAAELVKALKMSAEKGEELAELLYKKAGFSQERNKSAVDVVERLENTIHDATSGI